MSKAKKFWITRDSSTDDYEIWLERPKWCADYWYSNVEGSQCGLCSKEFERLTGIHLKGGPRSITCRRLVK